jgi:hypothetical protein
LLPQEAASYTPADAERRSGVRGHRARRGIAGIAGEVASVAFPDLIESLSGAS